MSLLTVTSVIDPLTSRYLIRTASTGLAKSGHPGGPARRDLGGASRSRAFVLRFRLSIRVGNTDGWGRRATVSP